MAASGLRCSFSQWNKWVWTLTNSSQPQCSPSAFPPLLMLPLTSPAARRCLPWTPAILPRLVAYFFFPWPQETNSHQISKSWKIGFVFSSWGALVFHLKSQRPADIASFLGLCQDTQQMFSLLLFLTKPPLPSTFHSLSCLPVLNYHLIPAAKPGFGQVIQTKDPQKTPCELPAQPRANTICPSWQQQQKRALGISLLLIFQASVGLRRAVVPIWTQTPT